ncbi:hypothetical protein [Tunicatimonas pelagia]|uniref:hypothetical protein n=1 Tax=Tunicatimonas pelagia TaxID=931531 RepID=UPI002665C9D4|nr:hypothetical protein [Tunicatimonas pelagia]WKN46445.1 hypothetical protein P0M28_30820 [Tunicatimonas pelagia]
MKSKNNGFRAAETLTELLQAPWVIIYDELNPQKIRKEGIGKELKQAAVQQLLKKHSYQQAERRVEQRLIYLIRNQLIWIKSQA